jgi:hypothetical protein
MTEQNILDLIIREGQPELDLNWDKLTQRFAHQLAAISHPGCSSSTSSWPPTSSSSARRCTISAFRAS